MSTWKLESNEASSQGKSTVVPLATPTAYEIDSVILQVNENRNKSPIAFFVPSISKTTSVVPSSSGDGSKDRVLAFLGTRSKSGLKASPLPYIVLSQKGCCWKKLKLMLKWRRWEWVLGKD